MELDFIFQRQPMPSYRSFHFDAYYNSFTDMGRIPAAYYPHLHSIYVSSASDANPTLPHTILHYFFIYFFYVFYQMKGGKERKKQG